MRLNLQIHGEMVGDVQRQLAKLRDSLTVLSQSLERCASAQSATNNRLLRVEQALAGFNMNEQSMLGSSTSRLAHAELALSNLNGKVIQLETSLLERAMIDANDQPGQRESIESYFEDAGLVKDETPLLPARDALDPFGSEQLGDAEEDSALPESLFSYCMVLLARSPHACCSKRILWLPLLLFIQSVLCFGFSESGTMNGISTHWRSGGDESELAVACMSNDIRAASNDGMLAPALVNEVSRFTSSWKLAAPGRPMGFGLVAAAAIFMNVACLCVLYEMIAKTFYPVSRSPLINCVVNIAWFVQACFLPGLFTTSVPFLIAESPTVMDMVMNSVAATFLLEIDGGLYAACLSSAEKASYQASARRPRKYGSVLKGYVHALGCFDGVYMVVVYCIHSFVLSRHTGEDYMRALVYGPFLLLWLLTFGVHGAVLGLVDRAAGSSKVGILSLVWTFVHQAILGYGFGQFLLLSGGPTYTDLALWHRCFD